MRDTTADQRLRELLKGTPLEDISGYASEEYLYSRGHGLTDKWLAMYDALPDVKRSVLDLKHGVRIGDRSDCSDSQYQTILEAARTQIPWRKGPWSLFGVEIDSEWRSDMKWDRLLPHIAPLAGRRVMDVGCGNAYHCYRALGEGARMVLGVDPHPAYFFQYRLIQHFLRDLPVFVVPVTLDQFPDKSAVFDTVFSMGVLYHRRSPLDHLFQLFDSLRPGGELVLETLIADGPEGYALTPPDRYCRMNNVWFLPSVATTESWLRRCGFVNVRTVDVNVTSAQEQRTTDWMPFQSLVDGLDPKDHSLSIEGLPGPKRAITLAEVPHK
ncbi:MAG: tRNA 5-methoxyuridine(34)/uridine 5-oxyacetic acid(34) synthase CmoB [Gammaproteobacteria bacterium]|nr:tRNA 5-methoxyuridine(34)/uridine 5-oxyacetic acid(34) synthase CmoB [Gammaproteobacteria bacterium]MBJ55648.1 tRNA 5-methoxyuridine(34)/uridine 5-oxyacetic acid(34) synthase CmoB [Gammaproteobacteria bacterium]HBN13561.1 tRNA 5-methoxyuridine(34)/uridine 5-oxyacetic acid(34) synthase CmoB [Pseudohongiella sp.]